MPWQWGKFQPSIDIWQMIYKLRSARHIQIILKKQLHQFITIIAKYRDVCAYSETTIQFQNNWYDFWHNTPCQVIYPTEEKFIHIWKKDLFSVVISLCYLIQNDEFKSFKKFYHNLSNKFLQTVLISQKPNF